MCPWTKILRLPANTQLFKPCYNLKNVQFIFTLQVPRVLKGFIQNWINQNNLLMDFQYLNNHPRKSIFHRQYHERGLSGRWPQPVQPKKKKLFKRLEWFFIHVPAMVLSLVRKPRWLPIQQQQQRFCQSIALQEQMLEGCLRRVPTTVWSRLILRLENFRTEVCGHSQAWGFFTVEISIYLFIGGD